jgi:hypothetical protein
MSCWKQLTLKACKTIQLYQQKPWQSLELQTLIDERRRARDGTERCRLSKCIQKSSRKELRRWHTEQAKQILGEFKDLDRLNGVLKTPFTRSVIEEQPDPNIFADLLREVYTSDLPPLPIDQTLIKEIPNFTFPELLDGLRRMSNGRSSDSFGILVEMIKDSSVMFKQKLLDVYNRILLDGIIEDSWHTTLFTMLPKSGNLKDPSNWRPILILPILYKIFSKMIYSRIHQRLEDDQCDDQCGFRPGIRIEDVMEQQRY